MILEEHHQKGSENRSILTTKKGDGITTTSRISHQSITIYLNSVMSASCANYASYENCESYDYYENSGLRHSNHNLQVAPRSESRSAD